MKKSYLLFVEGNKSQTTSCIVDYMLHKLTKVMWAGLYQGIQLVNLLSEIDKYKFRPVAWIMHL